MESPSYRRLFGRLRASLMGLLEVRLLEHARKKGEKTGRDEYRGFFDGLGESWGSRVSPLGASIMPGVRILAGEEMYSLLERGLLAGTSSCYCRSTFKNCDNPIETCIGVSFGESFSALRSRAPFKRAKSSRLRSLIEQCDELGLVHQTIFYPSPEYFYVVCNCCPCCCLSFRNLRSYGRQSGIVASEFIAVWDRSRCAHCGRCVSRCHFGARRVIDGEIAYEREKCYGCGLCVPTCPRGALSLARRRDA